MKTTGKTKKILKYIAIFSVASILIILLATGIIGYFYGDKIASLIIKELNKQIKTELQVEEVKFSALRKFPNATVELRNIRIKSSRKFAKDQFDKTLTENLIVSKRIFLSFSLIDIFNKKYKIKWIEIEGAVINILNDSKNIDNYHFWKEAKTKNAKSPFSLILQNVRIKNSLINLEDQLYNFSSSTLLNDCNLSGNFSKSGSEIKITSSIFVNFLSYNKIKYIKNKELKAEVRITENSGIYRIKDFEFELNKLNLYANALYNSNEELISFRFKGNQLNYTQLLETVPTRYTKLLPKPKEAGSLTFNLSYQNGENSYLNIEKLNVELGESRLDLKAKLINLNNPVIEIEAKTELDLSELNSFLSKTLAIDSLLTKKGNILAKVKYKGKLNSNFQLAHSEESFLKGEISVTNFESAYNNEKLELNTSISFFNNLLEVTKFKANYLSSSANFNGKATNLFDFLANKSAFLNIEGNLKSKKLNFNDFLSQDSTLNAINESDSSLKKIKKELPFWRKVRISIHCKVEEIKFNNFKATNFSAQIKGNSNLLAFESVEMKSMNGSISGDYKLEIGEKFINIRSTNSHFSNLDIKKAFISFDNFWQSSLLSENVKGRVHSENSFSIYFDYGFNMLYERNLIHAKTSLKNGSLINFKPIESMSSFVRMKELREINFSELSNEFFMKNSLITMPEMHLNSQILNMSISGEYSMLGNYRFSMRVGLYSFLANKFKRRSEVIQDSKASLGLYLLFSGNDVTYEISYDKKKIRKILKENSNYTKKEISLLLENEHINKDTTIISKIK